jgi:proline iminopeptidase
MRLLLVASVLAAQQLPVREGFIDVPGGKVWYRVTGSGPATPLLLLHGGPGGRSCSFSVLRELAKDRPLIVYDQLGSGRSERPTDASLWRVERFVEELDVVRKALGLRRVHILGHSWGGTLATEYLLTKTQDGVASVILASPLISTPRWVADARALRASLPAAVAEQLVKCEAVETADDPKCKAATRIFDERFVVGAKSRPKIPDCEGTSPNSEIYRAMWGAAEFTSTGLLRDYDRSSRLQELRLPVLFLAGRNDEARPETLAEYQKLVPGSKLVVLEKSAHVGFVTETKRYVKEVRDFLRAIDRH